MGRHKGLRLRGDRGEDALLLEALAIGAAPIVRGLEAGAPNLHSISTSFTHVVPSRPRTLRRLQYRHAIAVRCLGAG